MLKPHHVEELANPSALIASLLDDGISVAFEAHGSSMLPTIRPGDKLLVRPRGFVVQPGQVVLTRTSRGLTAHRVVRIERTHPHILIVTRGDNSDHDDQPVELRELLGVVVELSREGRRRSLERRSTPRTLLRRFRRRLGSLAAALGKSRRRG